MADDWQVGDLAVCVSANWVDAYDQKFDGIGPAIGDVCHVEELECEDGILLLGPKEWPTDYFFADHFRKIRPDEHEACEEEFRILLDLSKKRVSA